MRLPKKISPDSIKDAIVEFKIDYLKPFEVVLGLVLNEAINDQTYKYVNASNNVPLEIQEISGRRFLFYNENIKFHLTSKAITINCYSAYISWDLYLQEITKVIGLVNKVVSKIKIERIGLRYVSEYENIDLNECLKFNFTFGHPNITSKHYTFNSEFIYKSALIILTLRNLMPVNATNNSKNVSYIDIDVIKKDLEIEFSINEKLLVVLEEVHQYEKEIFFNLLKEEFLQTLQPEY
ncbi:TIGR04255 family protein [Gelidibacter japonicus]|uniref:TIGR04255 family protein n=1 Tax=Gelidibacter japonicus TaxID=1962232 RepID=UPI002AFE1CAB|nr:TIGR04255 family protein [Gelidibacter japonicus]